MTVTSYTVIFGTRIPSDKYKNYVMNNIFKEIIEILNQYFNNDISNIVNDFIKNKYFYEYDYFYEYYDQHLHPINSNCTRCVPIVNGLVLGNFPHDIEDQIENSSYSYESYFIIGLKVGEFGDGRKNFIRNDDSDKLEKELDEKLKGIVYENMIEAPSQDPRYFTLPNDCDCCS